jgi:hypothetical protein
VTTIRLKITYTWSGLEELCLPQADKVMAALMATDDRGPLNRPEVSMTVKLTSGRYEGPERPERLHRPGEPVEHE